MHPYGSASPESLAFHLMVYRIVQLVPPGHVTSYGHVAFLAGRPGNARQVGFALKHLETAESYEFNTSNVPWWRVINAQGVISNLLQRGHHIDKLREEVDVSDDGSVDLSSVGWFPEDLELT